MSKPKKDESLENGQMLTFVHNVTLLTDFSKALMEFCDFTKQSYSSPLNNSDYLDRIVLIHSMANKVILNHLDITHFLLDAALQKKEMESLQCKLKESRVAVECAIEYQKGIKYSIANDLAYSYHENYEN